MPDDSQKVILHGVTLETILTRLHAKHGWEGLYSYIKINCFAKNPSIKSSLTFLRRTPWAREKVENLYCYLKPKDRVDSANMSIKKVIIFILLTAVLVSNNAFCQEEINNEQIKTIVGGVSKTDDESGVVTVITGTIAKQSFADLHLNADLIWGELIKNGYIDPKGVIQAQFYKLNKFSNMLLPEVSNAQKKLIYSIFQQALANNKAMLFYVTFESKLLRGTHDITFIEIDPGDPVTIQYVSSSNDKNNIISLLDYKEDDN